MKRQWNRYIFVVLFGLLSGLVFSQELYENIETVVVFKVGSGSGELGIMPTPDYSHLEGRAIGDDFFTNGPSALGFDEEGNIYIMDVVNKRIVVYNDDYSFQKEIMMPDLGQRGMVTPTQIKKYTNTIFLYQGNLSAWTEAGEVDLNGTFTWDVSFERYRIEIYNYYYDIENGLFFQYLRNGDILCYSNLVPEYQKNIPMQGRDDINTYFKTKGLDGMMYIDKENRLVKNGMIIKWGKDYINSDSMGNMYYDFEKSRISILDKNKVLLKNMEYTKMYRTDISYPAIHPCGDIYFLEYKNGVEAPVLKRIKNIWDPAGRETWYALSGTPRGKLNDGGVRLRREANTRSEILGTYEAQTGFRILEEGAREEEIGGERGVWYKVKLEDGKEGWFFGAYVEKL